MTALFAPGGGMDYQRIYGIDDQINGTFIDFGNYNYGVVAAAAGYTLKQALVSAGLANLIGRGDKTAIYFNNKRNIRLIRAGYFAYNAGRFNLARSQPRA